MSKDSIKVLRREIDALDHEILKLLNNRASLSLQIGRVKAKNELDVYDPRREQAVLSDLAKHNNGPLTAEEIEEIFSKVIAISRRLQAAESANAGGSKLKSPCIDRSFPMSGRTSIYGILGNPIAHSMSPVMHNAAFRLLGLDAVYLPFEVKDLSGALVGMKALKIKGASVTHPFKRQVIALLDETDATAKMIGAVNTLVFENEIVRGTNTDWVGALTWLETLLPIKGREFVVLGAGGAARAVVHAIKSKEGKVVVVNRSAKKGQALAEEFQCAFIPLSEIERGGGDCLVNTTPVGMYPAADEMPVPEKVLGRYGAVADVIYNPIRTKLLEKAEAAGCRVSSGFEMFVYQGAEQFRIWTGRKAPIEEMKRVVYERLSAGVKA
ncbi:MAG: shikimate dehydrogenase [Deltaproteobacteria bacterium]|nr:MAG: shikimate dehydrogenase [Deltaproteobacteria bacterium]